MGESRSWVGRACPKCAYVRKGSEDCLAWMCPQCLINYRKWRPPLTWRSFFAPGAADTVPIVDLSVFALLLANVFALVWSWREGLGLWDLLVAYWIQTVSIGITHIVRLRLLKRFDPSGMTMSVTSNTFRGRQESRRALQETAADRNWVAWFFAGHYGLFHLVYAFLFGVGAAQGKFEVSGDPMDYAILGAVFALNHAYSLYKNVRSDARGRPSMGSLAFLPYVRMVPMHFLILLGAWIGAGPVTFWLFGVLKTIADLLSHMWEHHILATSVPPEDRA